MDENIVEKLTKRKLEVIQKLNIDNNFNRQTLIDLEGLIKKKEYLKHMDFFRDFNEFISIFGIILADVYLNNFKAKWFVDESEENETDRLKVVFGSVGISIQPLRTIIELLSKEDHSIVREYDVAEKLVPMLESGTMEIKPTYLETKSGFVEIFKDAIDMKIDDKDRKGLN